MFTFKFTGESVPNLCPVGLSNNKIGTSVSVYGIFSWAQVGTMTATYTLDGTSIPQTYSVTTRSPQFVAGDEEASNYILFASDTLAAGDHTLVINITQCVNQTFILDYITYTPSFSTLASMPNLTLLPTTPGSSSAIPPGSSSLTNGSQVDTKKVPIGAIVGGVLGGILFFVLIGFLLGYLRRRRSIDVVPPEPSGTQNRGHDTNCECSRVSIIVRLPMVICLDANSGSRAMVQVPPIGQDLSRSSDTVSPFPNVRPTGYPSMADIKRERLDYSNIRTAASPFPGTGNSVSLIASPPSSSPEPPITSTGNTDLLYSQDSIPPAYDNLSLHRYSNVTPP